MIDPIIYTLSWRGLKITLEELSFLEKAVQAHGAEALAKYFFKTRLAHRVNSLERWQEKGRKELQFLRDQGYHFIDIRSAQYPQSFLNLKYPPLAMTCLGDRKAMSNPTLAVVGSRQPSTLTKQWLDEHLSIFLKATNATVLSGGARGVDQIAHIHCFRQSKPTLCFLPAGLNNLYPSGLLDLIDHFDAQGSALVSQFSPFQPLYKSQFAARNELIALLAQVVFIVEAKAKSGTLLTAKLAISHDKEIIVLPFHPSMGTGAGNLSLLFAGAAMIRNAEDLIHSWVTTKPFHLLENCP